ncbi:MAG TPA: hypothetical protein VL326_35215 [Kofleriaceae bacterium]|nr:hypothetical protein [Kofleriaceae bacterium]
MARWWVVIVVVLAQACSNKTENKPAVYEESEGEREAKKIRESYRVVIADFHADIVAGRLDAAYARLAPMYQASVPLEKFAAIAKHPLFRDGVTFKTRGATITQGTAKVSGFIEGPVGPAQYDMRCTLVDGAWKIAGLSVDGTPVLPAAQ